MMHGMKNPSQSPRTISGTKGGHFCEVLCFLFITYKYDNGSGKLKIIQRIPDI